MSRIGKRPIQIPKGVEVVVEGGAIKVNGAKGTLTRELDRWVNVIFDDDKILIERTDDSKTSAARQGLIRSLIDNMVVGVTSGFQKTLNIVGVGYRAEVQGDVLTLNLGYSHPVVFVLPKGINATVEKQVQITIEGIDKQVVGETAAKIRSFRKPEPYKGKGILYSGEVVRRKIGKAGVK